MGTYAKTSDYGIHTSTSSAKMPAMHYHDSYEIYYLAVGSREYFIEDKLFSVAAGDFVLIQPGKLHRTGGEHYTRTLINFTGAYLARFYTPQMAEQLLQCFSHMKLVPEGEANRRCCQLLKEMGRTEDPGEFALLLGMLLTELGKCQAPEMQEDDLAGRIVAYLNRNYASITTLDQIANVFYISKYHLCRVFKNAMKMTVIDYLTQIRIKNARQLLEFSDKDIGGIARSCGFHSAAYFCNLYRRTTGESPTEFRKKRGKA